MSELSDIREVLLGLCPKCPFTKRIDGANGTWTHSEPCGEMATWLGYDSMNAHLAPRCEEHRNASRGELDTGKWAEAVRLPYADALIRLQLTHSITVAE